MLSAISPAAVPLVVDAMPSDPLAQALVGIVLLALVTIVGRFLLSLAWKLLTIAAVGVAILYGLTLVGI
ncbi:hypothetical protein [Natranaeroarchaeum aerophilus]|uniref:Uncharacterized protein n=1 Tax=Natranaeroarchaeum aerophilus TaxID=2917711 RepID=A0AAE3FQ04_9EURY|nr:hypothetical protein [Natranaeroarchaeum aerophilus]MCL9812524.1 hypothetical protein [Natranaeroarchaeum aerophilus]